MKKETKYECCFYHDKVFGLIPEEKTLLDKQLKVLDEEFKKSKQKLEAQHMQARGQMVSQGIKAGRDKALLSG